MQKIHIRVLSIVLLGVVAGFSFGCSHHPNDDAIAKDIQIKISADPDTKNTNVQAAAKDGKVTLTGNVDSPAEQRKVKQIAHDAQGTAAVEDQM